MAPISIDKAIQSMKMRNTKNEQRDSVGVLPLLFLLLLPFLKVIYVLSLRYTSILFLSFLFYRYSVCIVVDPFCLHRLSSLRLRVSVQCHHLRSLVRVC